MAAPAQTDQPDGRAQRVRFAGFGRCFVRLVGHRGGCQRRRRRAQAPARAASFRSSMRPPPPVAEALPPPAAAVAGGFGISPVLLGLAGIAVLAALIALGNDDDNDNDQPVSVN